MKRKQKVREFRSPVLEDSLDEALRAGSSTMSARHVILGLLRQKEIQRAFDLSDFPLTEVRSRLTAPPAPLVGSEPRFLAVTPSEVVLACLEEHRVVEKATTAVQVALFHCLLKSEPEVRDLLAEYGIRLEV